MAIDNCIMWSKHPERYAGNEPCDHDSIDQPLQKKNLFLHKLTNITQLKDHHKI